MHTWACFLTVEVQCEKNVTWSKTIGARDKVLSLGPLPNMKLLCCSVCPQPSPVSHCCAALTYIITNTNIPSLIPWPKFWQVSSLTHKNLVWEWDYKISAETAVMWQSLTFQLHLLYNKVVPGGSVVNHTKLIGKYPTELSFVSAIMAILKRWEVTINYSILQACRTTSIIPTVSLVRPHLEYASDVWDPYFQKDTTLIENVQKFHLRICAKQWDLGYNELLTLQSLLSNLADWNKLSTMFKIVHNLIFFPTSTFVPSQSRTVYLQPLHTQTLSWTLLFLTLFHCEIHYWLISTVHLHSLSLNPHTCT